MDITNPNIPNEWKELLHLEFSKQYFKDLKKFLLKERNEKTIFPPEDLVFNALNRTLPKKVNVVILGQDPYHGAGQSHGLAFSVSENIRKPPSLLNIFKEIKDDIGGEIPESGNLESWTNQGVLLLNAILTVQESSPLSHKDIGWELFTDEIIKTISLTQFNVVFMLWGNNACLKKSIIDAEKHLILEAAHPSPLSAYRGFFGCKHFSKANQYLKLHEKSSIHWDISSP